MLDHTLAICRLTQTVAGYIWLAMSLYRCPVRTQHYHCWLTEMAIRWVAIEISGALRPTTSLVVTFTRGAPESEGIFANVGSGRTDGFASARFLTRTLRGGASESFFTSARAENYLY